MAVKRRKSAKKNTDQGKVHQLRITLPEVAPPIWRQVLVPSEWTLGDLNYVLQVAMGWTNSHLHRFTFGDISATSSTASPAATTRLRSRPRLGRPHSSTVQPPNSS